MNEFDFDDETFRKNNLFIKKSKFPIEEVKEWYNQAKGLSNVPQRIAGIDNPVDLFYSEPDWKVYCTNHIKGYTVVDVDLTLQMQNDLFLDEHKEAYTQEPNWHYLHSYTRMVVLKSTKDNSKIGFLMTLIPSVEYIKNHKDKIRKTIYTKREKDYDGYILFHELNGTFSNGWTYHKGKIVASISDLQNPNDTINKENLIGLWQRKATYRLVTQPARVIKRVKNKASENDDVKDGGTLKEVVVVGDAPDDPNAAGEAYRRWLEENGGNNNNDNNGYGYGNDDNDNGNGAGNGAGGYTGGGGRRIYPNRKKSLEQRLTEMYTTAYEQIKTPKIKEKLTELQSKEILRRKYETGYSVNKDGTLTKLEVKGKNVEVKIKRKETIGYMHTHYDDYRDGMGNIVSNIKMFSPADVLRFLNLVGNAKTLEPYNILKTKDVFGVMVSSEGTYMLKYYGTQNPNDVKWIREGTKKADDFEKKYNEYFKKNSKEKAFLLFLKNEINFPGIQLIKITSDGKIQSIDLSLENKVIRSDY